MDEWQSRYIGPLVYHGSNVRGLEKLEPKESHLTAHPVVFAATLQDVAIAMAGHWTDDDFEFGREGQEDDGQTIPYSMIEKKPGAFEEFFNQPVYVYLLEGRTFESNAALQDFELMSTEVQEPVSYFVVENPLEVLRVSRIVKMVPYRAS